MANKVTFDYSQTAEYLSDGEITAMKSIAEDAKKLLDQKCKKRER